ncbi:MAG: Uncharacterised protein [Cryomorphaceae bacterium]|nr:MAG: Uncharacterised protein [Cryomorphaceae bacterium]
MSITAKIDCCNSGLFCFCVHIKPNTTAPIKISEAATVPEWNGRPMLLTKRISKVLNKRNTIGMIKAKTIAKTPILAPFAMMNPLRVVFGNFLK